MCYYEFRKNTVGCFTFVDVVWLVTPALAAYVSLELVEAVELGEPDGGDGGAEIAAYVGVVGAVVLVVGVLVAVAAAAVVAGVNILSKIEKVLGNRKKYSEMSHRLKHRFLLILCEENY